MRTFRSDLESKLGQKITLNMNIVPWIIRHASNLITRCRARSHGKTFLQVMKGRTSLAELVPFGETVLFKIPKTGNAVGSFEDRWEEFGSAALSATECHWSGRLVESSKLGLSRGSQMGSSGHTTM